MYTKRNYSVKDMLTWTRKYIIIFIILSFIPVLLYSGLNWYWLHIPWLPIGLVGTALAFIISFKNSASYDRMWEARKIWGGIVNTSRSFAMMTNDFITNEYAKEKLSDQELFKFYWVYFCSIEVISHAPGNFNDDSPQSIPHYYYTQEQFNACLIYFLRCHADNFQHKYLVHRI